MGDRILRGIGLQFFAEGDAEDGSASGADNSSNGEDVNSEGEGSNGGSDKTFTQEEVNKLVAKEKRKGRHSFLRELGLDPENKDAVANLKKLLEDNQSEGERRDKALKDAQDATSKETTRANAAERKLAVLLAGCNKDFVDEVTAMALAKMSEDVDFEEALEAVKKKMPSCFTTAEGSQDNGTGRSQGHRKPKGSQPGSYGAKLAESISTKTENPYFKN